MSKSIISNEEVCLVCGTPYNLHRHHVFYGRGLRKLSEQHGCWVYLCARHHNASKYGVHYNKQLDLKIKRMTQSAWESENRTREQFIKTFTRSYL